jgi:hypothetical protein
MLRRLKIRPLLFLLILIGTLTPLTAVQAQSLSCDDFTSQEAAQVVLDELPDLEEDLDPDGNGVACDEDEDNSSGNDADGGDYLATVQDQADALDEQVARFTEIYESGADATADDIDELNEIADGWVQLPDDAADLEAPAEYEDLHAAYVDVADTFGEAGELWQAYWEIPSGDAGEDEAFDEFAAAFADAEAGLADLHDEIAAAGDGSTTDTDDDDSRSQRDDDDDSRSSNNDDDDNSASDADAETAYLESVRTLTDQLNGELDDFLAMLNGDIEWDAEQLTTWILTWEATATAMGDMYPEVPAAYESLLHEPLVEYVTALSSVAESFLVWADAPEGSADREAAMDDFVAGVEDARSWYAAVDLVLTEAGY